MTPFLPDMSSPLSAPPSGAAIQPAGTALLVPGNGETPLDFAGLLGVATQTHAAPPGLSTPASGPASGLVTGPGAAAAQARLASPLRDGGIPGRLPSAEAGGRIVPETGAPLPVALPVREPLAVLPPEAALVPQPDTAAPVATPARAEAAPSPRQRTVPEAEAALDPLQEPARNTDPAGVSGPLPAPDPAPPVAAHHATPAPPPPIDSAFVPASAVIASAGPALAAQAPIAPAPMPARAVRVMGAAASTSARGVATQLPPAGPTLPVVAPVPSSTPSPTPSAPLTAFLSAPVPEPLSDPVVAPMPGVPADPAGEPAPTNPAPMPGTASSATPAPPAPAQAPPPAAPIAPPPSAPAEPASLGAQIESTIAQAGDLREALRSARPALTVQHGDFGAVSLRLEQAAPDQWRAVLASRDPGFIPAVQAALAERAVAPVADSAGSSLNGHGTSQNGTSEQRYGASPNAGQGGSQPYLGQSGGRDGEAAPDHRRASTAAAIAARAEEPDDGSGTSASSPGGLFA